MITESIQLIFKNFGGKVTHGPRKKTVDFGRNRDQVSLGLGLSKLMVTVKRRRMTRNSTRHCMLLSVEPSHAHDTGCERAHVYLTVREISGPGGGMRSTECHSIYFLCHSQL